MGYDAKGMAEVDGVQFPYGVVMMLLNADPNSNWKIDPDSKEVGKLIEVRLLTEYASQGPPTSSYDSYKIRYDCRVRAGVTRGELESWLATKTDGMYICPPARDDIVRWVYEGPEDLVGQGYAFWYDQFVPGKGRTFSSENPFNYWMYERFEGDEDDGELEEEDEEVELDGRVGDDTLRSLKFEELTEEAGCGMCGEDKAEIGSLFCCLPCGHKFHGDCAFLWLNEHCYCPTCNFRLPLECYDDYPCVCTQCLHYRDMRISTVPPHSPPFYRFYY